MIRWSIQEVRRIAIRLARKRIQPAHIIAWSLWRRAHQAAVTPTRQQLDAEEEKIIDAMHTDEFRIAVKKFTSKGK